jgi:uroporphyrinogen-III synthase
MSFDGAPPLRGRAVLVTRPVQQAEKLAGLIREAGGEPVLFPALAIAPPVDAAAAKAVLAGLSAVDLVIFVSPNAVERAFELLDTPWPVGMPVAAVGEGTAAVLRRHLDETGVGTGAGPVILPPEGADSEALLAMPELQDLRGKRVVICRGEGGRELLAEGLVLRGAQASYAQCYRRVRPETDPAALVARWEQGGLHAVTVMSSETLDNLWAILGEGGRRLLRTTPLFMPHAHIADRAARLGLTEVAVTPPGDEGILRGLSAWFALHAR